MSQTDLDLILVPEQESKLARSAQMALQESLALDNGLQVQIAGPGGEATTVELPLVVTRLLMEILRETAAGKTVSLAIAEAEITTQQAADLLNVSRPYLIGMIDKGVLPARMVGNQRRLPLRDVVLYKAENLAKRRKALREMTKLDQELGLI